MNDARTVILSQVRASLGWDGGTLPQPLQETLEERLSSSPVTIQPTMPTEPDELCEHFVTRLEAVAGTVVRVSGFADVPSIILAHLDRYQLPPRIVMSQDGILDEISWPDRLTRRHGTATDDDHMSVTGAFAAVAETGSLVLVSGDKTPTTLNFLPEEHVVILDKRQIVPYPEDVWESIRTAFTTLPRTINFITGPSRTADIEQTMQLGAHGPRRLTVILIEGEH